MRVTTVVSSIAAAAMSAAAFGSTVQFSDPNGLSAQASFSLVNSGSMLRIVFQNTTSTVPAGFGASDRLLTGIAFDMGGANIVGNGSSVFTGASSYTLNFNPSGPGGPQDFGANFDVSGEYGFGNGSATGSLTGFGGLSNHVSTNSAHTTRFDGANLDGPSGLGGPAGGLVSSAGLPGLGGQGAIHDEIIITLALSEPLDDLAFLENGVRVEFGSDRFFLDGTMTSTTVLVPLPGAAGMAGLGLVLSGVRRRR